MFSRYTIKNNLASPKNKIIWISLFGVDVEVVDSIDTMLEYICKQNKSVKPFYIKLLGYLRIEGVSTELSKAASGVIGNVNYTSKVLILILRLYCQNSQLCSIAQIQSAENIRNIVFDGFF
jgi:hypothetical protein